MNYQVLARKWRPRSFNEMVGQQPVVQALSNALNQNRLHHAYLFTGTRGVGKTSLARLLAKCLNCEQGVSAQPCNQCSACQAIDQGRFLDLQEIDAASRTKVEDTRELLDNVQYAPTQGRYKIYLIDEVHMLSNHSFNALLKTLEEPPPHVKFLLATTDPQRLPITILSRCLQFHLKNLASEQIAQQLAHIVSSEQLPFEPAALNLLAQAAQGSMRDALSLLDQAIAYGNGSLRTQEVQLLLGKTAPELVTTLLTALRDGNGRQLLETIATLADSAVDFEQTLEELLSALHQLALQQAIPDLELDNPLPGIRELAAQLTAETVQLYYQIGLIGRRDLGLAPTPRSGFEMVMLRMLAFQPQTALDSLIKPTVATATTISTPSPLVTATPKTLLNQPKATKPTPATNSEAPSANQWQQLLAQLDLQGAALVVASHCSLTAQSADRIELLLDEQQAPLLNNAIEKRLADALTKHFQRSMAVQIKTGKFSQPTPAKLEQIAQTAQQEAAVKTLNEDQHIKTLISQFNAQILPNSIVIKDNNV